MIENTFDQTSHKYFVSITANGTIPNKTDTTLLKKMAAQNKNNRTKL